MEPINSEILVRKGLISQEQLAEARRQKLTITRKLSDVLVEMGYITKEQMMEHLYVQLYSRIKEILEPLRDLEIAIGYLYEACADIFPNNADFWLALKAEEEGHARNIVEMIEIIYNKPHTFDLGSPIRKEAVQTFSDGVKETLEKIKNGKLEKERILIILKDIERGLIESKYFDVLKSEDVTYNRFLIKIRQETFAHRARLEALKP